MKKILAAALAACILAAALPGAAAGFGDVKPGDWYFDVVTAMVADGQLRGYGDGSFRPNGAITSAEFVTVAARMNGLAEAASSVSHWAAGHMQAALEAGWYDWDEIPPEAADFDRPISRQVAVKILMKALLPEATGSYNDWAPYIRDFDQLDGRYYEYVFAAYEHGVLTGDPDGSLRPKGGLSRAEACAIARRALGFSSGPGPAPITGGALAGGAGENGWLKVVGTQLCNEEGLPVVLRGMSTHGMQWYPQFASKGAMADTAGRGANLVRIAMYTGEGGYISSPEAIKARVVRAVDAAIELDMYVIIDWHILGDGNPNTYKEEAKAFFAEMARRYAEYPNVIYEICNEPNGDVTWARDIRPYACEVIPVIRQYSPQAIVLVGSGTWSQDVHHIKDAPLDFDNVMYTLHFYAGTHTQWLRDRVSQAIKDGTPIFASEWGLSDATGGGQVYGEEGKRWVDFMAQNNISWANWSLCDKAEASAALNPGASPDGGWKDSDLSPSGRLVFGWLGQ